MSLHVLRETNLQNVPATLRKLADAMESGEYGEVTRCALVWEGDRLHVSYCGAGEAGPNAHLLLSVGAAYIVNKIVEVKT